MKVKKILKKNTILIALIVVMIVFQLLISAHSGGYSSMFSPANISNLIFQNAYVVILAVGMLMCILTGGNIDLSVGSIVCLVGAIAGKLIVEMNMAIFPAVIICLVAGIIIGAAQAYWIAYIRIPPFIVTLAGMLLWRGLALVVLDGLTISPFPESFSKLFNGFLFSGSNVVTATIVTGIAITAINIILQLYSRRSNAKKGYEVTPILYFIIEQVFISAVIIGVCIMFSMHKGIPAVLVVLAIIIILYSFFTSKTVYGRHLYAMGGNEKAAKLSGINTNRTLFFAYTNMGFLAAVAALICVARFNASTPTAGMSYEMDAIASCFIGGASAYGGTGTVGGAVVGAIFMGVINNGMSLLGIDMNWQKVVKGVVLLCAVIFDILSKSNKGIELKKLFAKFTINKNDNRTE